MQSSRRSITLSICQVTWVKVPSWQAWTNLALHPAWVFPMTSYSAAKSILIGRCEKTLTDCKSSWRSAMSGKWLFRNSSNMKLNLKCTKPAYWIRKARQHSRKSGWTSASSRSNLSSPTKQTWRKLKIGACGPLTLRAARLEWGRKNSLRRRGLPRLGRRKISSQLTSPLSSSCTLLKSSSRSASKEQRTIKTQTLREKPRAIT